MSIEMQTELADNLINLTRELGRLAGHVKADGTNIKRIETAKNIRTKMCKAVHAYDEATEAIDKIKEQHSEVEKKIRSIMIMKAEG